MRDLFHSVKKPALARRSASCWALFAFGQAAEAANPLELNFWLSGPKYDGRVAPCEAALPTITSQFQEKESTFWNSGLTDHRPMAISTRSRSGPGSPTIFRAAIAAAT